MQRALALLGSLLFFMLAPGTIAGLIPYWFTQWRWPEPFAGWEILAAMGAALIVFGAIVLVECFLRFAWIGLGTPAPVAPTESLIVSGFYRHVRNPMYVAVTSLVIGQALVFARPGLAVYAAIVWLSFHVFVLSYEEPTLRTRYGESYDAYVRAVPRWFPRMHPWRG